MRAPPPSSLPQVGWLQRFAAEALLGLGHDPHILEEMRHVGILPPSIGTGSNSGSGSGLGLSAPTATPRAAEAGSRGAEPAAAPNGGGGGGSGSAGGTAPSLALALSEEGSAPAARTPAAGGAGVAGVTAAQLVEDGGGGGGPVGGPLLELVERLAGTSPAAASKPGGDACNEAARAACQGLLDRVDAQVRGRREELAEEVAKG